MKEYGKKTKERLGLKKCSMTVLDLPGMKGHMDLACFVAQVFALAYYKDDTHVHIWMLTDSLPFGGQKKALILWAQHPGGRMGQQEHSPPSSPAITSRHLNWRALVYPYVLPPLQEGESASHKPRQGQEATEKESWYALKEPAGRFCLCLLLKRAVLERDPVGVAAVFRHSPSMSSSFSLVNSFLISSKMS